jgi:hypothetical protein
MPANKKTAKKDSKKRTAKRPWVAKVTTDSTHPPEGLFNKGPTTIAKALASKNVSPKGSASGMRMLTYYINRAGQNLTEERRVVLNQAKMLLSKIVAREREEKKHNREAPKPKKAA